MSDTYEMTPLAHLYPGMVLADALMDEHGHVSVPTVFGVASAPHPSCAPYP